MLPECRDGVCAIGERHGISKAMAGQLHARSLQRVFLIVYDGYRVSGVGHMLGRFRV